MTSPTEHAPSLVGYRVIAADGPIGTVADVVDYSDQPAAHGLIVVDMDDVDLGVKRLVPRRAIAAVDGIGKVVKLTCTVEQVSNAPEMEAHLTDPDTLLDRVIRFYFG